MYTTAQSEDVLVTYFIEGFHFTFAVGNIS